MILVQQLVPVNGVRGVVLLIEIVVEAKELLPLDHGQRSVQRIETGIAQSSRW
jgi:hypothetical protein